MFKLMLAPLLAFTGVLSAAPATAQTTTRDQIRMIEQEYAGQSDGQLIPDNQLEYYLDRSRSGWTMGQISQDMANSQEQYADSQWQPQAGWVAREAVCSSNQSRYRECATPFTGRAVITQQISLTTCVEGRSWGQKPGLIWVDHGCRARFGLAPASNIGNSGYRRVVVCQSDHGRYRQCNTGFSGRVDLVKRLNNSDTCTEGQSWGQREGQVWVSRGCRAQFASVVRQGQHNDGNLNNNYAVTCSSTGGAQVRCLWDERYGRPRVEQQVSQSACVEGRSWGYDNRTILWVSNGCRARFVSSRTGYGNDYGYADGNDDGYGDGGRNRDNNYAVTCSSDGSRLTVCDWDGRNGSPRLVEQLSQSACIEGRSWGYDSRDGLWVNAGCRARFESR